MHQINFWTKMTHGILHNTFSGSFLFGLLSYLHCEWPTLLRHLSNQVFVLSVGSCEVVHNLDIEIFVQTLIRVLVLPYSLWCSPDSSFRRDSSLFLLRPVFSPHWSHCPGSGKPSSAGPKRDYRLSGPGPLCWGGAYWWVSQTGRILKDRLDREELNKEERV